LSENSETFYAPEVSTGEARDFHRPLLVLATSGVDGEEMQRVLGRRCEPAIVGGRNWLSWRKKRSGLEENSTRELVTVRIANLRTGKRIVRLAGCLLFCTTAAPGAEPREAEMSARKYAGMTVNERLFEAGLLDDSMPPSRGATRKPWWFCSSESS
jgi:hypothetical protein